MKVQDVNAIRQRFGTLSERANEALGQYDDRSLGIGRYVPGSSPWERHPNGDELLFVTDGEVGLELLDDDGTSHRFRLHEGALFVVPCGKWHQLTATASVTILYASPDAAAAERTREHPLAHLSR